MKTELKTELKVRRRLGVLTEDIVKMLRDEFYRGIDVGQNVENARTHARHGYVLSDDEVKLLREYDPDVLTDTPYDK